MNGPGTTKTDGQITAAALKRVGRGAKNVGVKVAFGVGSVAREAARLTKKAASTTPADGWRELKKWFVEKTGMGREWWIYAVGISEFYKSNEGLGINWSERTRQLGNEKLVELDIPRYALTGTEIKEFGKFLDEYKEGKVDEKSYEKNKLYQLHKSLDGIGKVEVVSSPGSYKSTVVIRIKTNDCTYEQLKDRIKGIHKKLGINDPASVEEATKRLWKGRTVNFPNRQAPTQDNTPEPTTAPVGEAVINDEPTEPMDVVAVDDEPMQPEPIPDLPVFPSSSDADTQADTESRGNTYITNNNNNITNVTNITNYYTINHYTLNVQINHGDNSKRRTYTFEEGPVISELPSSSTGLQADANDLDVIYDSADIVDSALPLPKAATIVTEEHDNLQQAEVIIGEDKSAKNLSKDKDLSDREGLGDLSDDALSSIGNLFKSDAEEKKIPQPIAPTNGYGSKIRGQNPEELALAFTKSNIASLIDNLPDVVKKRLSGAALKNVLDPLIESNGSKSAVDFGKLIKDKISDVLTGLRKELLSKIDDRDPNSRMNVRLERENVEFVGAVKRFGLEKIATVINEIESAYEKAGSDLPKSDLLNARDRIETIKSNIEKIPALKEAVFPSQESEIKAQKERAQDGVISSSELAGLGSALLNSCGRENNSGPQGIGNTHNRPRMVR